MRGNSRTILIALCAATALLSLIALIVLRSGRPLFYTDGMVEITASDLAGAPMQVWGRPEPQVELPGKIRGRVCALPDGRLLFGQVVEAATGQASRTDLVLFDPEQPRIAPVPAIALNSDGHDLAPALSPDGALYFASDRPGGRGGFDIYRSLYIDGHFGTPKRLPEPINTEADETDPAPHPQTTSFVFVRRHPSVDEGRNGKLWIADLNSDRPAQRIWIDDSNWDDPYVHSIDRDPAFSPDGVVLWFARQIGRAEPKIFKSWQHQGQFVEPGPELSLARGGPFRAPQPTADGFAIQLVHVAEQAMLYSSKAHLVYPWWQGQHALEFALLLSLLLSALLLTLLVLGRRWRQLDIITWCIILSLLIHILVLMWLQGVELLRDDLPLSSDEERVSVRLVAMDQGGGSRGGELSQQQDRITERTEFAGREGELESDRPDAAIEAASRESHAPDGERSEAEAYTEVTAENASLQDPTAQFTPNAGEDSLVETQSEQLDIARSESEAKAEHSGFEEPELTVQIPQAAAASAKLVEGSVELPSERAKEAYSPDVKREHEASTIQDRPDAAIVRRKAETEYLAGSTSAQVAPALVAEAPKPEVKRATSELAAPSLTKVAAPSEVQPWAPVERRQLRGRRLSAKAPSARASTHKADALRDAVDTKLLATAPKPKAEAQLKPSQAVLAQAANAAVTSKPHVARTAPEASSLSKDLAEPQTKSMLPKSMLPSKARPRPRAERTLVSLDPRSKKPRSKKMRKPTKLRDDLIGATTRSTGESLAASTSKVVELEATTTAVSRAERKVKEASRPTIDRVATALPAAVRRSTKSSRSSQIVPRLKVTKRTAMLRDDLLAASSSTETETQVQTPDIQTPNPLALADLSPGLAKIENPKRGSLVDGGTDPISVGIRMPPSFVAAAPRRDSVLPSAAPARVAGMYSNRFGPAKAKALERFGGSDATERAVALGLSYLAGIQRENGQWGNPRFSDEKYAETACGKTALCVLAFLGAGHTHKSGTEYSENVARALRFLRAEQDDETGHFGRSSSYSHGISTYALAECYAITHDDGLRRPLARGVAWILANQNTSSDPRNRGGWGYFSAHIGAEDHFSRSSVTSWMVMALESAKLSGLAIPEESLGLARTFLEVMFNRRRGYFNYNREPERLRTNWPTLPASTPAAVFCLFLLGDDPEGERIQTGLEYTVKRRPRRYRLASKDAFVERAAGNVYFWYYGTLACFLAGGEEWEQWNAALKSVLPAGQNRDGSFSSIGPYAEYAGDTRRDRTYSTAMAVLCLEVYYRYFTPLLEKR